MTRQTTFPTDEQKDAMRTWREKLLKRLDAVRARCAAYDNDKVYEPQALGLINTHTGIRLWNQLDIAVVMGRDEAFVADAFRRLREDGGYPPELRERLEECTCTDPGYARHEALYDDRIFDLLIDCQGEDYVQRLIHPMRETDLPTADDARRIRQFWEDLKSLDAGRNRRAPGEGAAGEGSARPLAKT